jgi:hypothetical protein
MLLNRDFTRSLEMHRRQLKEKCDKYMDHVHELEHKLVIQIPWAPDSDEWIAAHEKVQLREYRKAVDRLEMVLENHRGAGIRKPRVRAWRMVLKNHGHWCMKTACEGTRDGLEEPWGVLVQENRGRGGVGRFWRTIRVLV